MKDQSDDPLDHEQKLLPWSYMKTQRLIIGSVKQFGLESHSLKTQRLIIGSVKQFGLESHSLKTHRLIIGSVKQFGI